MIINKLTIYDFGIFSGEHTLCFDTGKKNENITLIGGMNGRGKTTILEAILLVLYGKRSSVFHESRLSYSAYLKKCINKKSKSKFTYIKLEFSIPDNGKLINILVKRSWIANKKRVTDNIEVWRDSHLDKHLSNNWDTFIEEVLPVGISGLFFFDGEKIIRLSEEEETSELMQDSIKALLGIDIVDRLLMDMKRLIQNKQGYIQDPNIKNDILSKEEELNSLNAELSKLKQEQAHLNTQLARHENTIREKERIFLKRGGTLKQNRDNLQKQKEELQEALFSNKASLVNMAGSELPLLLVDNLLEQILETAKEDENIKSAEHISSYLNTYNSKLYELLNTLNLTHENKKAIMQLIKEEENTIDQKKHVKPTFSLTPVSQKLIEDVLDYKTDINKIKHIEDVINKVSDLEKQNDQVERYMLVDTDNMQTEGIISEIKTIMAKINDTEFKIKKIDSEISRLEYNRSQLETDIQKLTKKAAEAHNNEEDVRRILKYASLTQDTMQAFKSKLTLKKVSELSEGITACFQHIIGKESLVSKIDIEPETLRISIYDNQGSVMKTQLSAGEKQILAIAILWGLAQSSGYKLPVIIDTPIGRLDSSHRANIISKYLPYASHQVIVLSTDEEISNSYLQLLEEHVVTKYLLKYDDNKKATTVVEGYFQGKVS